MCKKLPELREAGWFLDNASETYLLEYLKKKIFQAKRKRLVIVKLSKIEIWQ